MTIIVDNKAVGYDCKGKGKQVVVLLHGWGANRRSLDAVAKELSSKYTVISLDVPGFGESERPDEIWGLGEYASWLSACLAKLKVEPYVLVGHSNGGAIAIKAVSLGLAVEKLVLIGASGIRSRENGKKMFYKTVAKTGKVATAVLPKSVRKRIRGKWYDSIGSELYDTAGMEEFFKKVTSEDLLIDSAMLGVPTLLIYGSEDKATPPLYGRLYHESIDDSTLQIVEGAGHYVFVDKPAQTLALIKDFLK